MKNDFLKENLIKEKRGSLSLSFSRRKNFCREKNSLSLSLSHACTWQKISVARRALSLSISLTRVHVTKNFCREKSSLSLYLSHTRARDKKFLSQEELSLSLSLSHACAWQKISVVRRALLSSSLSRPCASLSLFLPLSLPSPSLSRSRAPLFISSDCSPSLPRSLSLSSPSLAMPLSSPSSFLLSCMRAYTHVRGRMRKIL